jgi:hypothetical protein
MDAIHLRPNLRSQNTIPQAVKLPGASHILSCYNNPRPRSGAHGSAHCPTPPPPNRVGSLPAKNPGSAPAYIHTGCYKPRQWNQYLLSRQLLCYCIGLITSNYPFLSIQCIYYMYSKCSRVYIHVHVVAMCSYQNSCKTFSVVTYISVVSRTVHYVY